jgi:uncharacterized integral membrane protein
MKDFALFMWRFRRPDLIVIAIAVLIEGVLVLVTWLK